MGYYKNLAISGYRKYPRGYSKNPYKGAGAGAVVGANQALYINDQDVINMLASIGEMADYFRLRSTRRNISNYAAPPIQEKARQIAESAFKGNIPVHYYRKGGVETTIYQGHTRASIQILTKKRNKLPKAERAVVGPLKTGKAGKGGTLKGSNAANPSNVDAYYAQTIFGSALAFGQQISFKALVAGAHEAFRRYDDKYTDEVIRIARKTGWR